MREDIIGGLRNALDRGETVEYAIRTFINAGYSEREVREAAEYATTGTLESLTNVSTNKLTNQKQTIKKLESKKSQEKIKIKHKSSLGLKVFLLGGFLLILAGVLISTIYFREQILAFFTEKFG